MAALPFAAGQLPGAKDPATLGLVLCQTAARPSRISSEAACLRVLRAHPSFAGVVLTEVSPTHDADGSLIDRYIDGVVGALAA